MTLKKLRKRVRRASPSPPRPRFDKEDIFEPTEPEPSEQEKYDYAYAQQLHDREEAERLKKQYPNYKFSGAARCPPSTEDSNYSAPDSQSDDASESNDDDAKQSESKRK